MFSRNSMMAHFDRNTLYVYAALIFISWAKYSTLGFTCVDGCCMQLENGEYSSYSDCNDECVSLEDIIQVLEFGFDVR